ncbi:MAG TPA: amidohydrolase family protein [Vicinamibacterales bacterium]|nr:amidohydrolase family protein [Vicinamibacterales bacterium]
MRDLINRREFLQSAMVIAAASRVSGQAPVANEWDGPVLDIHLHPRATTEGNLLHMEGSGVAKAVLLAGASAEDRASRAVAGQPHRFVRFASIDVIQPDAVDRLRRSIQNGAVGFGEIKSRVEAAGPEMQRLYALASELNVPITIHFQEDTQGTFNSGLKTFDAMLKAFPKTKFIGHANAFWANVSADYADDVSYPKSPIKPGGVTDRFLGDYANLYGDMSANSANNFLNRDPEFAAGFLERHQDKLMFGSDCPCPDGRGGATGTCIARATLTMLKKLVSPAVFRKITWENGTRLIAT